MTRIMDRLVKHFLEKMNEPSILEQVFTVKEVGPTVEEKLDLACGDDRVCEGGAGGGPSGASGDACDHDSGGET